MGETSYTFSFSGNNSILESTFFPPLELAHDKKYVLGLVDLYTSNSIPNIYTGKNKFYVGGVIIEIPTGCYEISTIESFLQKKLKDKNIDISLKANNSTLQCEIRCNQDIHFYEEDSIYQLLGFSKEKLEANITHFSHHPIRIIKVNTIRISCNIIEGTYNNGDKVHIIHEFFPTVPAGYKIIEIPKTVIYLPIINIKTLNIIRLRLIDQDGDLIDFRGEDISIRLHLKVI